MRWQKARVRRCGEANDAGAVTLGLAATDLPMVHQKKDAPLLGHGWWWVIETVKNESAENGDYCNELIWHHFFKGACITSSTSQRQKPESHGDSCLAQHRVILQTSSPSGKVQNHEGKSTNVTEEAHIQSCLSELQNTSVKQLLLPSPTRLFRD